MRILIQVQQALWVVTLALPWGAGVAVAGPPTVGVLTLHGVGSQRDGSGFDAKLRETLQKKAGGNVSVVVQTVYYHGEVPGRQAELWDAFDTLEDQFPKSLDQKFVRRIMLVTLGDALAYTNHPRAENSFYRKVHGKVRSAIDALDEELGDGAPVAVVAHSLGGKVILDYLSDVQSRKGIWQGAPRPTEFQQLANLRLLITTGCNLPFFQSAVPVTEQRLFRAHADLRWINFYDRDDLLGWPLRPLGGPFARRVQDEERNTGSVVTCHVKYWKNEKLNDEIAERILELVRPDLAPGEAE